MKIKLCGKEVELNVDMTDAKDAARLESSVEELYKELSNLEHQQKKHSQIIQDEVKYTRKWLDELLGDGAGQQVLTEDGSLQDVYFVFWTMHNLGRLYSRQISGEAIDRALEKYSPQRAQRSE